MLACAAGMVLAPAAVVAGEGPREETIKSSFVYNFGKFTEWPGEFMSATPGQMTVCLVGAQEGYLAELARIEGKRIQDKEIRIKWLKSPDFKGCHIAAFGVVALKGLSEQLSQAARAGTLTVGEGEEFVEAGGMIGLVNVGYRILFDVNLEVARVANLRFSAQMLKLARSVK